MGLRSTTRYRIHNKGGALDGNALFFYPDTDHWNGVPVYIRDTGQFFGAGNVFTPEFIIKGVVCKRVCHKDDSVFIMGMLFRTTGKGGMKISIHVFDISVGLNLKFFL